MVRVTTSRGKRGSRRSAVAAVSRANSAYASSTTTIPGAAAQMASITPGVSAVPVGLFGEVRNTRSGCSDLIRPDRAVRVEAEVGRPGRR